MDLNMAEPKNALSLINFTGDVLDIPNANKKKILDQFDTGISILDELPREKQY
jgi:hypothetical protein